MWLSVSPCGSVGMAGAAAVLTHLRSAAPRPVLTSGRGPACPGRACHMLPACNWRAVPWHRVETSVRDALTSFPVLRGKGKYFNVTYFYCLLPTERDLSDGEILTDLSVLWFSCPCGTEDIQFFTLCVTSA